jgi:hypothetical protein
MSAPSSPNGIHPVTATATSSTPPTTPRPVIVTSVSNDFIHPANDNHCNDAVHSMIPEHMPCVSPSLSSVASDTLSITDVIDISQQQTNIINTDSIMDTVTANTSNTLSNNDMNDKKDNRNGPQPHSKKKKDKVQDEETVQVIKDLKDMLLQFQKNVLSAFHPETTVIPS